MHPIAYSSHGNMLKSIKIQNIMKNTLPPREL